MELLTSEQMRAVEQAAIQSGQVTGLDLMERAGQGVVAAVLEEWPDLGKGGHRAVVLCGPGNNGGDGFVVARLLKERGWQVEVFLFGDSDKLPPDAKTNCALWGASVRPLDAFAIGESRDCDLLVDALFGTGLTRGLLPLAELFWNMGDMVDRNAVEAGRPSGRPAIVAIDIPSGICADSGRCFPHADDHWRFAASAHLTVTFHTAKPGHYLDEGPSACGKLVIKDIGLVTPKDKDPQTQRQETAALVGPAHPSLLRKDGKRHKYGHGHALILSGPPGKGGAARLAARGALRVGAGLVTVGCPMRAVHEHAVHLNAIMVQGLDGTHGLAELLEDKRYTALCLGPGLGLGPSTGELVKTALASGRGTVLDADALTRFQRDPSVLFDLLHETCVLTPHGGEFARLFPDISEKLAATPETGPAYSKVDATRDAAARAGCVVLFKGPDTVIAAPDGQCCINAAAYDRAAPWLATAGSGDVLAGIVCGLLARGMSAMQAAETGAWLHVDAARAFGPGLIAEDLPETLPQVFREMGL
ncbi:NAD(P)H-hydrate dehydratase [Antarctobacter sp.]|uniref:NAD(P)H-hydrate dehydratase n=1 Tax=Antarctobacter sp. TaxID=1872577 RepID=UPI002B26C32F|nr:NAD(P)H-hydrate dehydratase [Antarctobacter sp.]